ncbi:unnamed protein product [Penicillium palitans]
MKSNGQAPKSDLEIIAGQNAIKLWILTKDWQRASYIHEPGRGPVGGLLNFWCGTIERIAENDADFAARFGTRFHRFPVPRTPGSSGRSRRPSMRSTSVASNAETSNEEHEDEGEVEGHDAE